MYSVYQHWDPLKVCAVGRSYPPEFYSWIKKTKVRQLFERIASETEEDYQLIIKTLQSFGVEIVRPNLPAQLDEASPMQLIAPPMNPRDSMVMIGEKFYAVLKDWSNFYKDIKDPSWPPARNINELSPQQQQECIDRGWLDLNNQYYPWKPIYEKVSAQGNQIKSCANHPWLHGAGVSRIGKDLYFMVPPEEQCDAFLKAEFPTYRTHIIRGVGHGDGTYCPICPGLIVSIQDAPTYAKTFPDWEVVYLPNQSWDLVKPFLHLKQRNGGRWWIPGWEYDADVIHCVEQWLGHWMGYVEETVFDVNMLVVDPKNVIVFNQNEKVFRALERFGITPHVVTFRHRYFWDGGIHCVTLDLHREGTLQDFFPSRS